MNFDEWSRDAKTGTRFLSISALAAAGLFIAGFCAWGVAAPLAGAVVVPGTIVPSGHDQQIQHLEGGIVRRIFIKEGEKVIKGQALVALDSTAALAQRDSLKKQLIALRAQAERLSAERDGIEAVHFSDDLTTLAADPKSRRLLDEQRLEFEARLKRHHQEQAILRQRIAALHDQIDGMEAQRQALERELTVVREEMQRKKKLLDEGLTDRDQYTELLRSEAQLVGQSGQAVSNLLASRTQISEAKEQLARLTSQRVETALTQLNELRPKIATTEEQLRSAEDVVSRLVVRAPSDGVVVKMNVNIEGSVIKPGDVLLELLPTGEHLLVETHVSPQDIDSVAVGQQARLRLTALNARRTPTVAGKVIYVSADQLFDQNQHKAYYVARLSLENPLPKGVTDDDIYPGMPVEAYITTTERTFAEYLVRPIMDSFSRAFRED